MNDTVRRYRLKTPEIYRRWSEVFPEKGRPVLRDIAAASGVSTNSLSVALRGIGNVLPGTADRLANVLGCTVVDIAEPVAFTPIVPNTTRKVVAITFAMDTELMGDLNRHAAETGRNRSIIVRDAVTAYLSTARG